MKDEDTVLVALALLPPGSVAALGETVAMAYVNARDRTRMPMRCTVVTSGEFAAWSEGWYAVTESGVKVSGGKDEVPSVTVSGKLKLILCDGASLETANGLYVPQGSSLTIWAQSTGDDMGKLNANHHSPNASGGTNAGIEDKVSGVTVIKGGNIITPGRKSAGIGSGAERYCANHENRTFVAE